MRKPETLFPQLQALFAGDSGGHDWFHTLRVYRAAMAIAREEPCEADVVALAALLHDVDDAKLFATQDYANARRFMAELDVPEETARAVVEAISTVSFKGTGAAAPKTVEGKIVQDADRLDAIGAIGIGRAFAYGGSKGRQMYDPAQKPNLTMDEQAYRANKGHTINHFYEKLLLLEGKMHTPAAKRLARHRTAYMEAFLAEFYAEWAGER